MRYIILVVENDITFFLRTSQHMLLQVYIGTVDIYILCVYVYLCVWVYIN